MSSVLPDATTPFGQQVARGLQEEPIGWLTTVGADGTPQPNLVWFYWDGEKLLVYNRPDARRLVNIGRNPHVAFNLNSDSDGEHMVVITGEAKVAEDEKSADQVDGYVEKYRQRVAAMDLGNMEVMAREYSVALHIRPTRVRGF